MARNFNELRNNMSPDAQTRAKEKSLKMIGSMPLYELRMAREISQEELGQRLDVKQSSVSKLERRTDMYISSLRRTIAAMGGQLEIVACFPDGKVKINQFEDIEGSTAEA